MIQLNTTEEQNRKAQEALDEFRQKVGATNVMIAYTKGDPIKIHGEGGMNTESIVGIRGALTVNCQDFETHVTILNFVLDIYRRHFPEVYMCCMNKLFP
ncbi:hypothetical protein [Runella zeae]|uniref:hypothetical protein n=1 Tax=Runella zeae TaxID=94255 RepID=UPI0003FADC23|nr:hypothetical protein [Runella zeae]